MLCKLQADGNVKGASNETAIKAASAGYWVTPPARCEGPKHEHQITGLQDIWTSWWCSNSGWTARQHDCHLTQGDMWCMWGGVWLSMVWMWLEHGIAEYTYICNSITLKKKHALMLVMLMVHAFSTLQVRDFLCWEHYPKPLTQAKLSSVTDILWVMFLLSHQYSWH